MNVEEEEESKEFYKCKVIFLGEKNGKTIF